MNNKEKAEFIVDKLNQYKLSQSWVLKNINADINRVTLHRLLYQPPKNYNEALDECFYLLKTYERVFANGKRLHFTKEDLEALENAGD